MSALKVQVGDEVYWTDPDEGLSSGYYVVTDILVPPGEEVYEDTIFTIRNEAGSTAEVFLHELS